MLENRVMMERSETGGGEARGWKAHSDANILCSAWRNKAFGGRFWPPLEGMRAALAG